MFALVDCNSFYASCERVFRPDLKDKPIVVLSNNDGCVVALTKEAKAIGVKMCDPWFEIEKEYTKNGGVVFSSNYELYADISSRVMDVLEQLAPRLEIYSIDEAFLEFKGFDHFDLQLHAQKMRQQVGQWTGIPVSIGIAPSKALAKIANKIAKKFAGKTQSVYCIDTEEKRLKALRWTAIGDVWGVGRQHHKRLESLRIKTALDFVDLPDDWIRKHMSILGLRLKKDLLGLPCIPLEENIPTKKNIATTRSFEGTLTEWQDLEERVSTFATSCAEKIRRQHSSCQALLVFVRSDPHKENATHYRNSCVVTLPYASDSTLTITKFALEGLKQIFRAGIAYKKAGVIIMDLSLIHI